MTEPNEASLEERIEAFGTTDVPESAELPEVEFTTNVITGAIGDTIETFGQAEPHPEAEKASAWRTAPVAIGESGNTYVLRAERVEGHHYKETLLRTRDGSDSEEIVLVHDHQRVTDGEGRKIESQSDIRLALELVKAIREQLWEETKQAADTVDAHQLAAEGLAEQRTKAEERLAAITAAQEALAEMSAADVTISIHIRSGWSNSGEKSPTTEHRGMSLEEAIAEAADNFRTVNNRSDVQGRFTIGLELPNEQTVQIPEELWSQVAAYHAHKNGFDRAELWAIEQAEKAARDAA